jgi:hypothetical protein
MSLNIDFIDTLYFSNDKKYKYFNIIENNNNFMFNYSSYDFEFDEEYEKERKQLIESGEDIEYYDFTEEKYRYTFDKYSNKYYQWYSIIDKYINDQTDDSYSEYTDYSKLYYYYLKYKVPQILTIEEDNMYTILNIDWYTGCEFCNKIKCKFISCFTHLYSHFFVPGTPSYIIHKEVNTVYESRENAEINYFDLSDKIISVTKYIKLNNYSGLIKLEDLKILNKNNIDNIKSVYIKKGEYNVEEIEKLF